MRVSQFLLIFLSLNCWMPTAMPKDMGMIGIPCPLFSRLNINTRKKSWSPFDQLLGTFAWECFCSLTQAEVKVLRTLQCGLCVYACASSGGCCHIHSVLLTNKAWLLSSQAVLAQAESPQSKDIHSGGGMVRDFSRRFNYPTKTHSYRP